MMHANDRQSIFGDTYEGVPSPLVPHEHPYPTRYHGANWTYPRFGLPYVENPLAVAPYAGLDGACSSCRASPGGELGRAGPDGLGEVDAGGPSVRAVAWAVASTVGTAAGVYHGYQRNQSIGWALAWGLFGAVMPIVALPLAVAQGFGKKK